MIGRGIAVRIALAALASAAVGLAILAAGVAVVGAEVFTALMVEAGDSADHARAMYDESVTTVVVAAVIVAALASITLAVLLARMLARPLAEVGGAARRIAEGDYAARVPRQGPEELASLADSFNQMAASLERQEQMRNDFIANAAHELRTPLTNLQGYLEALRDGVITADRATYESLWDEAERLVRLSHSLDSLARFPPVARFPPPRRLRRRHVPGPSGDFRRYETGRGMSGPGRMLRLSRSQIRVTKSEECPNDEPPHWLVLQISTSPVFTSFRLCIFHSSFFISSHARSGKFQSPRRASRLRSAPRSPRPLRPAAPMDDRRSTQRSQRNDPPETRPDDLPPITFPATRPSYSYSYSYSYTYTYSCSCSCSCSLTSSPRHHFRGEYDYCYETK